ncbi:ROK family transcriptional regulator [Enterocloster asparagiformis]|uniref:ROK family transcriptional regulator n=1 Tax=Enterocloster asparagiformis TaxID=333367 RepID=UPI0034B06982
MAKGGNPRHLELIRRINRSLILNMVKERQPVSRAQLARALNLSKTTVSSIVDELVRKKLLVEYGDCCPSGGAGRPSVMLGFNPRSAYCIGIDIASANLRLIITDLAGEALYETKRPPSSRIGELIGVVEEAVRDCGLKMEAVFGMGIGVPGIVTAEGSVVRAKFLGWSNFPLKRLMEEHFPFPVFVENGVNLAALGERWLGSGDQVDDMLFVRIGTGIGGAVICGGQLIRGAGGNAGEIGYFLESRDVELGNVNQPGQQGVLERKCSGAALTGHGRPTEELFVAYGQGDREAARVVEPFIRDLSVAIANCVSLLGPAKAVIGGDVSEQMSPVIYRLREEVERLTPIRADVCLASLGGRAGALGAVFHAMTEVEQQDLRLQP